MSSQSHHLQLAELLQHVHLEAVRSTAGGSSVQEISWKKTSESQGSAHGHETHRYVAATNHPLPSSLPPFSFYDDKNQAETKQLIKSRRRTLGMCTDRFCDS